MKMIDKVALILIRDRKVLFVRSKGKDTFYTLGGKRELGESDIQTIVREVFEEVGAHVIEKSLVYLETFNDVVHTDTSIKLKLTCYLGDIIGDPKPSSEIEEMLWLDSTMCETYKLTKTGKDVLALLKKMDIIN